MTDRPADVDACMTWYEEWFDQDAYELVYRAHDEHEGEPLIELLERTADPAPGSAILDVACGRGRHARILARHGFAVTGIDLSRRAIEQARLRAAKEGLAITFRQQDMREAVCEACFDGAVNLFTAFGYFEEEADHQRALDAMAAAIKPGGWLLQDFLNVPYVLAHLVPEDERTDDNLWIHQRRWVADGRIEKAIELRQNGEVHHYRESVRLLTLEDFRRLYRRAGLEIEHTYGTYDGRAYGPETPRLLLFARKRAG